MLEFSFLGATPNQRGSFSSPSRKIWPQRFLLIILINVGELMIANHQHKRPYPSLDQELPVFDTRIHGVRIKHRIELEWHIRITSALYCYRNWFNCSLTWRSSALEHMRRGFGVAEHWMPHQLSAQRLADMANPIGKEIGPEGDKLWVGLPLVVHRRCDRPMFEVANRIAYSGGMVYGTSPRVSGTPLTLPSGWVQVSGTSQGNWVPSEGRALNRLVTLLTLEGVDPKSIAVVTPFGDVARQVAGSQLARAGATCGTVHTMQGKEAACVVLVLGGNADP
ncbi:hypothetical protein AAH995_27475 [Pseudomonas putida]|uniref:hypothetical protein n=1 Tax=Pseudomonas putida TaxID=303 RepID=UPI00349EDFCE